MLPRSSGSEILDRYMPPPSLTLSGVFRYRAVVSEPDAPPPPPAR
jgi:hypothetical protein